MKNRPTLKTAPPTIQPDYPVRGAQGAQSAAVDPVASLPIYQAVDAILHELDALHNTVNMLTVRLHPVMESVGAQDGVKADREDYNFGSSGTAATLSEIANRVVSNRRRLSDVKDALEL